MEKKAELLRGKKIKVKYIPGGNSVQMSPSKEEPSKRGFFTLEETVIAALNVADDVALEEGEMTKSELKKLKKKMKRERRERKRVKVKEEKKVKEERGKYSGLWKRETDGAKVCVTCRSLFASDHGLYNHLNTKVCGFGSQAVLPPKKDWSQHYKKDGDRLICSTCLTEFAALWNIHRHLKTTPFCSEGVESQGGLRKKVQVKRSERRNYLGLYQREEAAWVCIQCSAGFLSQRGVHNHLIRMSCGFGSENASAPKTPKRDFQGLWARDGDKFTCRGCNVGYVSQRGVYYHLTQTWCGVGNLDPAESARKIDPQSQQIKPVENQLIKPVKNQQIKPVENQQIKPVENQQIKPAENQQIKPAENQ